MIVIKDGGHRLFEHDEETAKIVSSMLLDLEKKRHGCCAKIQSRS